MTLPPLNHHFFQWVSPVPHQPTPLRQSLWDHRSEESQTAMKSIDAFTPMSDQDRVSPYNIRKIMMRIEKIINWELLVDSRPNLQSNLKGLYCRQKGELLTNKVLVLSLIQSHFSDNYLNKLQQISKNLLLLVGGTSCDEVLFVVWLRTLWTLLSMKQSSSWLHLTFMPSLQQ